MSRDLDELLNERLSYEEMMNICREETRDRICEVLQLCLPYSDTPEGRILLEEQLYGVLIQMLSFIQINTGKYRRERQAEGIKNAKANGVHFGRKKTFVADNFIDLFKRLENGEITKNAARAESGASPNTFNRMYKQLKAEGKL